MLPSILLETEETAFWHKAVCTLGNCKMISNATCNETSSVNSATDIFTNFLIKIFFKYTQIANLIKKTE